MKPQAHTHEDRLLEFAYGELPPQEARAVELHVQSCTHCSQSLSDIRGVRTSMARLPLEPAPEAGLDSLLAYSQQAARRAAAGPAPAPRWWRRWLVPALGLASVAFFGVIVSQVQKQAELSPPAATASKTALKQEPQAAREEPAPPAPPAAVASAPAPAAPEGKADRLERVAERQRAAEAKKKLSWSNRGMGASAPADDELPRRDQSSKEQLAMLDSEEPARRATLKAESDSYAAEEAAAGAPAAAEPMAQDMAPGAPLRLGGSASPRPSKAAPAAPQAVGSVGDSEMRQAAYLQEAAKDMASPEELSLKALLARKSGDRAREAALLRLALASEPAAGLRVELLGRLCEAELALGHREAARGTCDQLLSEAPDSATARRVHKLLGYEPESPAQASPPPPTSPPRSKAK